MTNRPNEHEQREREREREHEQRERERAREHEGNKDNRQEDRQERHAQPKALSGADLGHIADLARLTWADKLPHALTDRLGRGWNVTLLHGPFDGLYIQCGEIGLGLTYMALDAKDAISDAVEALAKAVPPAAVVPVPEPAV